MVAALALLSSFVLASATILIRLGLRGGGPYSLDRRIGKEL